MGKAIICALFAGAAGAVAGSLFDSGADHLHGQVCGLIAMWRGFGMAKMVACEDRPVSCATASEALESHRLYRVPRPQTYALIAEWPEAEHGVAAQARRDGYHLTRHQPLVALAGWLSH
jgi:hypothetical protein